MLQEKFLTLQLSIRSLSTLPLSSAPDRTTSTKILQECSQCLLFFKTWYADVTVPNDLAHEPTRDAALFVPLYGLLLSGILAVYLFADHAQAEDVPGLAAELLEAMGVHEEVVHPRIKFAVKVLARAQPGGQETKCGLTKCCFLVLV